MTLILMGWAVLCAIAAIDAKTPFAKLAQSMWALGFMVAATLVEVL